jgi:hypothetical protein
MSVKDPTAAQDLQEQPHPTQALDDIVHQRVRLRAATRLTEALGTRCRVAGR